MTDNKYFGIENLTSEELEWIQSWDGQTFE